MLLVASFKGNWDKLQTDGLLDSSTEFNLLCLRCALHSCWIHIIFLVTPFNPKECVAFKSLDSIPTESNV